MKRIAALILAALTLTVLLTGCIHENIGVKLNEDGTGSMSAAVGVEKNTYDQLLGMGVDLFADSEAEPGEYEYKGKTYVSVARTAEYESYDELKQALLDLTYESDELAALTDLETDEDAPMGEVEDVSVEEIADVPEEETPETNEITEEAAEASAGAEKEAAEAEASADRHIFKEVVIEKQHGFFTKSVRFYAKMNPIPENPEISLPENSEESAEGDLPSDAETPLSSSFLVTLSVEMPYAVTGAGENATVEGNKAVIEINDLTAENEITVEAEKTDTGKIVTLVAILILIVICVFVFVKLSNKGQK